MTSAKKGLAALIVAQAMPKKGEEKSERGARESSPFGLGLQAASAEILAAFKKGDEDALTEALCAFIDQHLAGRFSEGSEEYGPEKE